MNVREKIRKKKRVIACAQLVDKLTPTVDAHETILIMVPLKQRLGIFLDHLPLRSIRLLESRGLLAFTTSKGALRTPIQRG